MRESRGIRKGLIVMLFMVPISIFLFAGIAFAQEWVMTYGGPGSDAPVSIQKTSDGGYIVAGQTYSFGAGGYDVWILKLDSIGNVQWQKAYGGSATDYAYSVQQTSDGGYIVASYTYSFSSGNYGGDAWVLKLDSNGNVQWQKTYGGSDDDRAYSIQQTSDGGYIVAGSTCSYNGADSWDCDVWVLKLDSIGNVQWQKTYGGGDDTASSVQQTVDGGYIVAGTTFSFGAGNGDIWVLKLNADGTISWQKTYGGSEYDCTGGDLTIQQTYNWLGNPDGYVIVGTNGSFGAVSYDIWILRLNLDGTVAWQKTYGSGGGDEGLSIQQTADGGYIVGGVINSFGSGSSDAWLLKLNADGTISWQKTFGGSKWEGSCYAQQAMDGGYIVASVTSSFGAGNYDVMVLKLDSNGDIPGGCPITGTSSAVVSDTIATITGTSVIGMDTNVSPQMTSAVSVNTNATVTDPRSPATIGYSPTSFCFTATQGSSNPSNQALSLSSTSCGPSWSVSDNATWLTLNPTSGTNSGTVTLSVNIAGLTAGTYNATITITATDATNSPVSIPVTLTINPPSPTMGYSPNWTAEGNQAGVWFGFSVGTAGDVNGDGYSDVIVGEPWYDNGRGKVFVYYGSASGLSPTANWTAEGDQVGAEFGCSVGTAGDVNGDGYSDVIVGARSYSNSGSKAGKVYVYHGAASGPSNSANWVAEGNQADANLGYSVGTAGDVNGDGYSDVIIGAPHYTSTGNGMAYVYHGAASGLSSSPNWVADIGQADARFGWSVATVGDVNRDGYSDVIVGAPYYDNGQTDEGKVFAYRGSASGLSTSPNWTAEGNYANALFGWSVGAAGDVNGDGFSDVIVGAKGYSLYYYPDAGKVFVYYGSASGLSPTANWTAQGENAYNEFGYSVGTAGDVNGDGFSDVIIGAWNYSVPGGLDAGRAYIYHGSPSGLSTSFDWKAQGNYWYTFFGCSVGTAGNVNGDGFDDVIVGAAGWSNNTSDYGIGRAYVYHGDNLPPKIGYSPTSFSFSANQGGSNPSNQALNISNIGGGILSIWRVVAAYADYGLDWLSFSPTTCGTNSISVTVSCNIAGLTRGTYDATIYITDTDAVNSPVNIPVTLNVLPPAPPPTIGYNPISFSFTATQGGSNPSNKTLSISNTGGGTLNWSVSDNATWLGLSPTSGTNSGTVTVSVNIAGLTAGTYNTTITITATGATNSPVNIPVTLTINVPPVILLPNGSEVIPSGSTYTIRWSAPPEAVKFTLKYSINNGSTWKLIAKNVTGTSYNWIVPCPNNNKANSLVKVIGFNASGIKVGEDTSDATFKIEVVKVTSPDGGEILEPGEVWTISWQTNCTIRPVANAKLFYTTNGGSTWKAIKTLIGNPGSYGWTVPNVTSSTCKVKVVLKDTGGVTIGSDISDANFTIQP
jgi:hypothetical protein